MVGVKIWVWAKWGVTPFFICQKATENPTHFLIFEQSAFIDLPYSKGKISNTEEVNWADAENSSYSARTVDLKRKRFQPKLSVTSLLTLAEVRFLLYTITCWAVCFGNALIYHIKDLEHATLFSCYSADPILRTTCWVWLSYTIGLQSTLSLELMLTSAN